MNESESRENGNGDGGMDGDDDPGKTACSFHLFAATTGQL
jgi:hypothetical protein